VAEAGCGSFAVHARKAWLSGLSPKQNREIPPLRYGEVYRLKQSFPKLEIVINGGIMTLDAAAEHLRQVDGVMLGRAAYQSPFLLAEVDRRFFGETSAPTTREATVAGLVAYAQRKHAEGVPVKSITRHVLGLFNGLPGARAWRRHLSEAAHRADAGPEVIEEALALCQAAARRRDAA